MNPEREWKLAADWQLAAEVEYWDRAITECDGSASELLTWHRNGAAGELARRERLTYHRAHRPFDLAPVIAAVKDRADLLAILGRRLAWHPSGYSHRRTYAFRCFIHEEQTASLTVWPDQGRWWCFGCQTGGDAIAAVMRLDQVGFVDAVLALAAEYGIEVPERPARTGLVRFGNR